MGKKKQFFVGAKAVLVNDKKVLLLKNVQKNRKSTWDLPGGGLEEGESLVEALKREVREETGITNFTTGEVLDVRPLHENVKKDIGLLFVIFLCKTEENSVRLSEEHGEHKWITKRGINKITQDSPYEYYKEAVLRAFDHA